jgi:filamentous hemagglutinin family protein
MLFKKPLLAVGIAFALVSTSYAELTFDSDGSNLTGAMIIEASRGTILGANLLHSFSNFNVQSGESATFTGPAVIDNVIARVTGTSGSNIQGMVRSNIESANLFLINPNGIMFGEGAALDIDGSLFLSTANSVTFADGSQLLVSDSGASGFTTAVPSAFGFDVSPAEIRIESVNIDSPQAGSGLAAKAPVNGLIIIGGDINIDQSRIYLANTAINIVSLGSAGSLDLVSLEADTGQVYGDVTINGLPGTNTVSLETSGSASGKISFHANNLTLSNAAAVFSDSTGTGAGQGIDISLTAVLDLSGASRITTDVIGEGNGGNINIEAAMIKLQDRFTIISSDNRSDNAVGGRISLTAVNIDISGSASVSTNTIAEGNAGSIDISTGSLALSSGAAIGAQTSGDGDGGNIAIVALDDIQLSGDFTGISSSADFFATGNAGDISLTATNLSLEDSAFVLAESQGFFAGAPGKITIAAEQVMVSGLSTISSDNNADNADSGNIVINANTLTVSGAAESFPALNHSAISSSTGGNSTGGSIQINANKVTIDDGAALEVVTFGQGNGGSISVIADLTVDGGQLDAKTEDEGDGGDISITGAIDIINGGRIDTSTPNDFVGVGSAGRISTNGASLSITGQGSVLASNTAGEGDAGQIVIGSDAVAISGGGSIDTSTKSQLGSAGSAGSIALSGQSLSLSGVGSTIQSQSLGPGAAGSINANVASINLDNNSAVQTDTQTIGLAGSISLASQDLSIIGATISSATAGDANGGSINIRSNNIALGKGASITVTASGLGNAGDISLKAENHLDILDDSKLLTNAALSGGGSIDIDVLNRIYISNSTITASSKGAVTGDDGGNITIDPIIFILDRASIVAQAVKGNGGIINLFADNFISDINSLISATSELGNDGEVVITSPDNNVAGVIGTLDVNFSSEQLLLKAPCAARVLTNRSSLIVEDGEEIIGSPEDYASEYVAGCSP